MMDNFKKKFLEEAMDNIHDLEEALLLLEKEPEEKSIIERAFRAMHSLKGGGAMFGFEKISQLTHHLESIYDHIRNGRAKLNEEILNMTFSSVDFLKRLLNEDNEDAKEIKSGLEHYMQLIGGVNNGIENGKETATKGTTSENEASQQIKTYFIYFKPKEDIFKNGTNPLYLIDELANMGSCFSIPRLNKIPKLGELDLKKCYTYWEVLLATAQDPSTIHDVFMFVEDDCELEITPVYSDDLFKKPTLHDFLKAEAKSTIDTGVEKMNRFIAQFENEDTANRNSINGGRKGKENSIASIRVGSEKLDNLMNLVSELVTTQARLSLFTEKSNDGELLIISENIQKLTRQLRDTAFSIVLIPVDNMVTRFQRMVRDLSKNMNKSVDFVTEGTETELDKNIIESLNDPIMHILRNSLDHGIEDGATRKKKGKAETGRILFKAYYSGASVHIQVQDDGAGINPDRIRSKAIEKGLISAETVLTRREIFDLIFLPGFSTAETVTDVSGRGVGMDVVKRKIADIRGEVEIDSEPDKGTTITIKLPLTLSIIDGLLVKLLNTHYILPLHSVNKIFAVQHSQVVDKFNSVVVLDGKQIPYFYLRDEFDMVRNDNDMEQIVVVSYEDKQVGLVVDNVVGEYQAVLKSLGKHYKEQDFISGATILGDGTVALVMDLNKTIGLLNRGEQSKLKQE